MNWEYKENLIKPEDVFGVTEYLINGANADEMFKYDNIKMLQFRKILLDIGFLLMHNPAVISGIASRGGDEFKEETESIYRDFIASWMTARDVVDMAENIEEVDWQGSIRKNMLNELEKAFKRLGEDALQWQSLWDKIRSDLRDELAAKADAHYANSKK